MLFSPWEIGQRSQSPPSHLLYPVKCRNLHSSVGNPMHCSLVHPDRVWWNKFVPCFTVFLKWFKNYLIAMSSLYLWTDDDLCYLLISRLPEPQREKANRDSSLRISTTSYWSKCCQEKRVGKENIRQSGLVNSGGGLAGVVGMSLYRSSMQNMPRITWKSPRNGFQLRYDV